MNYKMIFYILGYVLLFEALFMLVPLGIAIYQGEISSIFAFIIITAITFVLSLLLIRKKPVKKAIYAKEGFIIVGLAWILISFLGSFPFYISGTIPSFIDAFFEAVSGFTTTGVTTLSNIDALPVSMIFWRSFTNWIGGMGVLVFILAIISLAGGNAVHLMRAESPGPSPGKLVPKIGHTAKILYSIYLGLTVIQIILLLAGGMPLFDSIVNAFSTAGTGGFSINNNSIAHYDSAYLQGVITTFMIIFGVTFNFYYFIIIKKLSQALRYEEVWVYLIIIGSAMALVTMNIYGVIYQGWGESFRYASFQVASVITSTGFSTADFATWPQFSQITLLFLMFVGGCAGSTAGGIKVIRLLLLFKAARLEMDKLIHPRAVQSLHLNGKPVDPLTIRGIRSYMVAYILIVVITTLVVSLDGFDFTTTFSAIACTINNVGVGLGAIGPSGSFADFSILSKIMFIFNMLAGRLEIFPIWIMLMPGVWKGIRNAS
ncbi:MAG: TrkH family potassium uptake protein [Bacillota bacterium]|jgi:trk system potassium uptake protein TrkH